MNEKHLVSIVTPVHNGAEYIEECIASVLGQTYANWEYTIVDNASSDRTAELVAGLAAKDSRIRLVRFEEFVCARESHNRAFACVSPESEFCKVVQADDWLYPACLERMVEAAEISSSIGIVSAYRIWGSTADLTGLPYWRTHIGGREILRQSLLGGPYVTGAPTALLLRSRFVLERDPFYASGFRHEDTEAAYWLLSRSDFAFVHQVLTFARRQRGARMEEASRINTYIPENVRFVLRYGREVLSPAEYRSRLRLDLWSYVRFHLRQVPKRSRLLDPTFFAVHRSEVESILREGAGDPDVERAMSVVKGLLARRRVVDHGRQLDPNDVAAAMDF